MRVRIPVSKVVEVADKAREAAGSIDEALYVSVLVGPEVPRWMAMTVKEALVPQMGASTVDVQDLRSFRGAVAEADLAILLAGGSEDLAVQALTSYARAGVPCAVCVETSLDAPEVELPEGLGSYVRLVAGSSDEALLDALCQWMLDEARDPVAVAANFVFCRAAETDRLIQRCALSNAAVGTVDLIHGADLPIMVANQAKLVFDLAAAHGEGASLSRLAELAAVTGAGFAYRGLARTLTARVRPLAFAVRGLVGYAGSLITGSALAARFGEQPVVALDPLQFLRDALAGDGAPASADVTAPDATAPMPRAAIGSADLGTDQRRGQDDGYIVIEAGSASA